MFRKHFPRVRDSGNNVNKLRDSGIYEKLVRDSGSRPPLPDPVNIHLKTQQSVPEVLPALFTVQVHWNKCYFIFIQVQVRFLTILQCSFVNERSNRNGLELQTFVSPKHPQLNNYHCDKIVIVSKAWKIQTTIQKPPKFRNEAKLEHWSVVQNLRVVSVSTVSSALDQHSTAGWSAPITRGQKKNEPITRMQKENEPITRGQKTFGSFWVEGFG